MKLLLVVLGLKVPLRLVAVYSPGFDHYIQLQLMSKPVPVKSSMIWITGNMGNFTQNQTEVGNGGGLCLLLGCASTVRAADDVLAKTPPMG
jgi:hypothetical protein